MTDKKTENLLMKSHMRTAHPYSMWEQIHNSPNILRGCLEENVVAATKKAAKEIVKRGIRELIFTGTGTSFFSGLVGEYGLAELAGMSARYMTSHELKNYPPVSMDKKGALVGISHSGGTLVTIESIQLAKKRGSYTIAIVDVPDSKMAQEADIAIVGPGGKDYTIPKTRSYMSGIFRVMMLVVAIADEKKPGTWEKWFKEFQKVPGVVEKVLKVADEKTPEYAKKFLKTRAFYCIGFGVHVMTAHEGALKLLETSQSMAQGLQAEEAIHGPLAALDERCALVLIAPDGIGYERVERIAKGIHHFRVPILALAKPGATIEKDADYFIGIPNELPELLAPIAYIPPLYLLSYWIAIENKINPDILKSDNSLWVEAMNILMPPGSH